MKTPTILSDEIIKDFKDSGEYDLKRNKSKYEKRKVENERLLGKLELEERDLRADFYFINEPDAIKEAKHQINEKQVAIEDARADKETTRLVLNKIDKLLEEIVSKANNEQMLKYLKSLGISTIDELKQAFIKSI